MMHPIKSVEARQQGWTLRNFEKTKYSKLLKQFKDIHKDDEACFIIGNGPSLSAEDLDTIQKHEITTFAFNRIYYMFANTVWRPTYYISQDEKTLKNCQNEVNQMSLKYKFIPLFHKYYHNINIDNAYYFKLSLDRNKQTFFSEDISKYVGDSTTVACTAMQFAVYMGFKKIYLIGVDHSFSTYKNDDGEIITDPSVKDYFVEDYNNDKSELYIPNIDASTRAFMVMKKYCDSHGIEVYNATRGGKLEVFPRVNFDLIF